MLPACNKTPADIPQSPRARGGRGGAGDPPASARERLAYLFEPPAVAASTPAPAVAASAPAPAVASSAPAPAMQRWQEHRKGQKGGQKSGSSLYPIFKDPAYERHVRSLAEPRNLFPDGKKKYVSEPSRLGSWSWLNLPECAHGRTWLCTTCGATHTYVHGIGAPQAVHEGAATRLWATGQSGVCPTCKVPWREACPRRFCPEECSSCPRLT